MRASRGSKHAKKKHPKGVELSRCMIRIYVWPHINDTSRHACGACHPPSLGLAGHPPPHPSPGAQESGSPNWHPPTPRPQYAAPSHSHSAVLPPQRRHHQSHAITGSQVVLRHYILNRILPGALHEAGIASALEAPLCHLPGLAASSGAAVDDSFICVEARKDILMDLPQDILIMDVSVAHSFSPNILPWVATTAGAAVSARDQQTWRAYVRVEPYGYGCMPFSVKSYGHLGPAEMQLLHDHKDMAVGLEGICVHHVWQAR
jgi:hypothetical protein